MRRVLFVVLALAMIAAAACQTISAGVIPDNDVPDASGDHAAPSVDATAADGAPIDAADAAPAADADAQPDADPDACSSPILDGGCD